jgi:hypothetical protein
MDITYATAVTWLHVRPTLQGLSDVVCAVDWSVTGTVEGLSATVTGTALVNDPDPSNFLLVNALSEAVVLGWISSPETQINRNWIEADLRAQLDAAVQLVAPPWE